MEAYKEVSRSFSNTVSRIDQNVVNTFITEGYYERHLNKMRSLYKAKHDCLLNKLKKLGSDFTIAGESAGLHILVTTDRYSEEELISRAEGVGVKVYPLSSYYIDRTHKLEIKDKKNDISATVIIGYAKLSEADIEKGIDRLIKAWSDYGKDM